MTQISFYHLSSLSLEKALPKLLEKIIITKQNSIILTKNPEQTELLNDIIWTYSTRTFIPHGSDKDEHPEEQPIYLTHKLTNPNKSSILINLTDTMQSIDDFDKYLDIFDGNNDDAVSLARKRFSEFKASGKAVKYWKQQDNGAWIEG